MPSLETGNWSLTTSDVANMAGENMGFGQKMSLKKGIERCCMANMAAADLSDTIATVATAAMNSLVCGGTPPFCRISAITSRGIGGCYPSSRQLPSHLPPVSGNWQLASANAIAKAEGRFSSNAFCKITAAAIPVISFRLIAAAVKQIKPLLLPQIKMVVETRQNYICRISTTIIIITNRWMMKLSFLETGNW